MPTLFSHRIMAIVPVGVKLTAVGLWLRTNLPDPTCDETKWPGLNPSGLLTDALTHRWFCAAYTDAEAFAILSKLVALANTAGAGITVLGVGAWNGSTRPQKRSWLLSVQAAIRTSYGVYVTLADNEGVWDDPGAALAAMGLKVAV